MDLAPPLLPRRRAAIVWIVIYALVIAGPVLLVDIGQRSSGPQGGFLKHLANNLALAGFAILVLQFVMAARIPRLESPFGLDYLLRFHRAMGLLAVLMLLAHPILLAWGTGRWWLLTRVAVPWPVELGRLALLALVVTVITAVWRQSLRLEYQRWRRWHGRMVVFMLVLAFVHSLVLGVGGRGRGDLAPWPLRAVWIALAACTLGVYVYHRWFHRFYHRKILHTVTSVKQESRDVWTLTFAPVSPAARRVHSPGQFHYLTILSPHVPPEEHPFSISSSPAAGEGLASTIKIVGDFTALIPKIKPGDQAYIRGPFGRFSYLVAAPERPLVLIAGGVGITPLMSMLRHLRDTRSRRSALLVFVNRSEEDIIFREELAAMEALDHPQVRVVHVLSRPSADWRGPRGRLNRSLLIELLRGQVLEKDYYVCGPPAMAEATMRLLREIGVPPPNIHSEQFSY